MNTANYLHLKQKIAERGFAGEIEWATNVADCPDSQTFACETIWVILNAGMREQVARIIQDRIWPFLHRGESSSGGFNHKLKCRAIDYVWRERERLFAEWRAADDRLEYLERLPHIGPITKYHLARNLGMNVCKPDRHLVRIAAPLTPHEMCAMLAKATGDRIGVVDCVIWRSANLGLI